MRLAGQAAIVTGGGGGIGHAVSLGLAAEGATVFVADLDDERAELVADEIREGGGLVEAARVDITRSEEVERLVAHALERHEGIDVLVNNAGTCQVKPFLELTEDDLRSMWETHALGTFLCSRAVLPRMRERGYGRIVNVVSGPGGYGASAWTSHYQSAKSAQTSFGRSMALAFAADGITVNCVSPGLVVTGLWDAMDADFRRTLGKTAKQEIADRLADPASFPRGRPVEPEEVARVVVFLALPESGAINGEVLNI